MPFQLILLINIIKITSSTPIQSKTSYTFLNPSRNTNVASTNTVPAITELNTIVSLRGGSTTSSDANKALSPDLKWRIQQQQLLQLRSTFLSEALAARGIPLTTMMEVSTLDSEKPPDEIDWDCVLSTESDPKSCLYSFDAQPNTKVLAPTSTNQYISLIALNRLRRTDPSKVEPMWHSQYSILKSWFGEDSPYSLMQHVGIKGFFVSTVLLDWGNGIVLKGIVLSTLWMVWSLFAFPMVEYISKRFLVSGLFWSIYGHWSKIVHAAFPFKLLLAQMGWKFVVGKLDDLTNYIRDYIVEWECQILEECVPVTVHDQTLDENSYEDVNEFVEDTDSDDYDSDDDF